MRTALSFASASVLLFAGFVGCGGNVVVDPPSSGSTSSADSTSSGFGGSVIMTTDAASSSTGFGGGLGFGGGTSAVGGAPGFNASAVSATSGVGGAFTAVASTDASSTTAVASSSSSSSGVATSCDQCFLTSCQTQLGACEMDKSCRSWSQCAQGCFTATPQDPACFAACDAKQPSAKASYDALYACVCSSCNTPCSGIDACNAGADGGP